MDPYSILGVPRGCTREQLKEAYRSLVHRAHPDRGGDGEAFIRLCSAYRDLIDELEREGIPSDDRPDTAQAINETITPPDPGSARESYAAWMRQVSEESARRRSNSWWRKHPDRAKAWLLGLIGLGGILVLCAALALGLRSAGHGSGREMGAARGLGPATASPRPARD